MQSITARLFPLPNVVLFPKIRLPLHIFEPRYRQMMRDALGSDHRIAIGLLQPGWESNYYGNPPVFDICCVGLIDSFEELQDGTFNLVLHGELKIRIQKVLEDHPYRLVEAAALQDQTPTENAPETKAERLRIQEMAIEHFTLRVPETPVAGVLRQFGFEELVNWLAGNLAFTPAQKQELLELDDLRERGLHMARFLEAKLQEQHLAKAFRHLAPENPSMN